MMIHTHIRKTKPKVSKQAKLQYENWLKEISKPMPTFTKYGEKVKLTSSVPTPRIPPGRDLPKISSLNTGFVPCTKSVRGNVYTGDKMIGIGTLHKSNAVPVFNSMDAVEISRMRRG
jgi:hypothetical protein